jgi:hypothetical protein
MLMHLKTYPPPGGSRSGEGGCRIPPSKIANRSPHVLYTHHPDPPEGDIPIPPWGILHPPRGDPRRTVHVPAPKGVFEGGIPHPPRRIKHPPAFRGFSLSLEGANGMARAVDCSGFRLGERLGPRRV